VPKRLLIPGIHIHVDATNAVGTTAGDVALADGTQNSPASKVSVESEEALEVHVQILSDGFLVGVPAADAVDELER
jgi:hypothetical protein